MSVNINVITQYSNKTLEVIDMNSNSISTNYTNEVINLPYDTSYILYISPTVNNVSAYDIIGISDSIFTGMFGYIWFLVLIVFAYYLINGLKAYVK